MGKFGVMAVAGAAVFLTLPAAQAADMPPLFHKAPPPMVEEFSGGWYLRGDIGMTNQRVKNFYDPSVPDVTVVDKNFEAGMLFGLGVGYRFNNWLRVDVTGEYRGETGFHGLDIWAGDDGFNNYSGKKSEWLALANVYFDLGTWHGVTPFVGAGLGFSRVTIHSFKDAGIGADDPVPTLAYAGANSVWNFAWAVHAGLAYQVTPNFTVELAYRYTHLGNGRTGDAFTYDNPTEPLTGWRFDNIDSHDLKLGVRWNFNAPAPRYMPPLMTRG